MTAHDPPTKKRNWILKRPTSSSSSSPRPSSSSGPAPIDNDHDYEEGAPLSRSVTADSASSAKRFSLFGSSKSSPSSTPAADNGQELKRTKSAQPSSLSKTTSTDTPPPVPDLNKSLSSLGFAGRMSLSSMMGGLSSLSLSRTSTNTSIDDHKEKERGRSTSKSRLSSRSQSQASQSDAPSRSQSRTRSQSPFSFRRLRNRDPSPAPSAVLLDTDSDGASTRTSIRPRNAFTDDHDSDEETINGGETTDGETDDEGWSEEEDIFDPETERNTEANAFTEIADAAEPEMDIDPDPLGEGVNVVVPPEPYFPSTLNTSMPRTRKMSTKRKKSAKPLEPLPLKTSRPNFQRDRCTITLTQGDPAKALEESERKKRMYVVASDLSEESRYAVEWGIGTVLRDGDEMLIVTVVENEARIDPASPNTADKTTKLRSQQERQGLAYILVRQATSLLQRTRLNVTIHTQAWHAKNARHMILDVVDHNEPVMLIVGSRGLGQLKNILLGSTSHYLIQKCSVPVMVARRRLKRPPRKSAHLAKHRARVSLAEAGIDRVAAKVDEDVRVMRENIQRDDETRDGGSGSRNVAVAQDPRNMEEMMEHEEGSGSEGEEERAGVKVAGD